MSDLLRVIIFLCLLIGGIMAPWLLLEPDTFWQRLAMFAVSIPWAIIWTAILVKLADD